MVRVNIGHGKGRQATTAFSKFCTVRMSTATFTWSAATPSLLLGIDDEASNSYCGAIGIWPPAFMIPYSIGPSASLWASWVIGWVTAQEQTMLSVRVITIRRVLTRHSLALGGCRDCTHRDSWSSWMIPVVWKHSVCLVVTSSVIGLWC